MNKNFIVKIVKAKQLEYEAIKEILPRSIRLSLENFEKDAERVLKDVAIELIKEKAEKPREEVRQSTKKVQVDFS